MASRADVIDLVRVIVGRWPRHAATIGSDLSIADYERTLAAVAIEHARAALEAIYRDGETFPPNGGQIVSRIADLALDIPTWAAVKAAILRWDRAATNVEPLAAEDCPHGLCEGDGMVVDLVENTTYRCRCWPERLAARRARRARHPLIAVFLCDTDPREFGDLESDRVAEAQVRQKWEAFVRGLKQEIVYAGIDPAGLPALERITATPAERAGLNARGSTTKGLRQPSFMRLVEGGGA